MKRLLLLHIVMLLTLPILSAQSKNFREKTLYKGEVYFDFGKHALRPEADSVLAALAEFCKGKDNITITITAHTDSIGSNQNNLALSQRRMEAVKKALDELGVSGSHLELSIFGETQPATSNRTEEGRQKNRRATIEVFSKIALTRLEGNVVNPASGKGIEAEVIVHSKETRDSLRTDTTGYFKTDVPVGEVVGVDVFAEGYFFETQMLKALPGKMKPLKIEMKPALPGEKVDIQNLYFVGNQAVLLEKSKPELPKVLRFMQVNRKIKILVAGHVNFPNRPPVTKNTFEYKLSVARAKMVYDYLIENGIPAERISFQGFGNWEMRYPNGRNEEEQALNRRVEIQILENKD